MNIETIAIHAGQEIDPSSGSVIPPIYLSTTFERAEDGSFPHGNIYTRSGNPNRSMLERCLTALEGGADCAAFGSGQAAAMAVFQALRPGDHVVAPDDAYHGVTRLLRELMAPWGLEYTQVDMRDPEHVRAAIRPSTRLVWVETPSNPLLKVADIAAVAAIAHEGGAACAVDNTWATPALQRPLELGADLAVHATTKYLGGHSDVLGGAVVAREAGPLFERVRFIQGNGGAVPAPFDCWLVLRGIRTLAYRVRAHAEHAMRVARFLDAHPQIARVYYPGLESHPGHEVAARQMRGFGGMLSAEVRGGQAAAMGVAARVKIFTRATSLGGTESLIEHRASVEGPESTTPPSLLRISVGLEHPDDLIADLEQALG
ncbi:aminotransferase class V-fold PLP-dependent enzyme [Oscillochloris sp. ZM17-4]|uniref:trans-sulfuration enzyme family protein n=1 Tax=Oscillochloris sp. ZM17-4 TaxID=2866714 RepID=UPI001C739118|nr:aminotransferase class V-fold PLP-dependent enzyme [Oscillochloris sp. ZM17-4]MBX0329416.1 aminotransferase class V-fold PLP-dependent enzyme [Oscillochloris sp. ZM17-4]